MNAIRQTQALNERELEACTPPAGSWHRDYADTAFIFIGGLPFELSEGDLVTMFSQYGEPVYINLVRDKETGKSKGFAFLKYADQRSCDLAVDNLGGATIMGRMLRVDHTRYQKKDDEDFADNTGGQPVESNGRNEDEYEDTEKDESPEPRPLLKEEKELAELMRDEDDDDPMKPYLIERKKEEVEAARRKLSSRERHRSDKSHRHRSHRSSRKDHNSLEKRERRQNRSRSPSASHHGRSRRDRNHRDRSISRERHHRDSSRDRSRR